MNRRDDIFMWHRGKEVHSVQKRNGLTDFDSLFLVLDEYLTEAARGYRGATSIAHFKESPSIKGKAVQREEETE